MQRKALAGQKPDWAARVATKASDTRRRAATVAAIAVALLLGYHAVAGKNGLTVYQQKMAEDRQLALQVKQLQEENDRLQRHVQHLAADTDAIAYEAQRRLRYTTASQVIVLNDESPASK